MLSETRKRAGASLTERQDAAVAEMISALDNADYPHIALRCLGQIVPYDAAAIFIYSVDSLVYKATDELVAAVEANALSNYTQTTYRFSPFFQQHRRGLASGIYPIGHLARDPGITKPAMQSSCLEIDPSEELGYRTFGWPKRLVEVDIAIKLPKSQTAQIALYRTGRDYFRSEDIAALSGINRTLSAMMMKFWQKKSLDESGTRCAITQSVQFLAKERLSKRELEVIMLGFQGLEMSQIAAEMGVSQETVKSHRKNAYSKLGARSQTDVHLAVVNMLLDRGATPETSFA